jgi:site-specific DNA-methyltransferase (adenine-specific)
MTANPMFCLQPFVNKVYACEALQLLGSLPTGSIRLIPSDPIFGAAKKAGRASTYDRGPDPYNGDFAKWWRDHEPVYNESLRVLAPGGVLAWSLACSFHEHFDEWFGPHRKWSYSRWFKKYTGKSAHNYLWMVQTKERQPVRMPDRDSFIYLPDKPWISRLHPCPKSVIELRWMLEGLMMAGLAKPGDIVLDYFCGSGSHLVAAKQLGMNYIGCDRSPNYVALTKYRLNTEAEWPASMKDLRTAH